jgi:dihydrofolate reductase
MGSLTVINHISLDGVMQGPASPEEDVRGDFEHGGWAQANGDQVMADVLVGHMREGREGEGGLLLGRWTYESFFDVWPHRRDNPFTERLNNTTKYVASTTLAEPLPWQNSVLLSGDVPAAVRQLKDGGTNLAVLGSGALIRSLLPHRLIDEWLLMIHPVVLGSGERMFADPGAYQGLSLTDSLTTTTGVIIATYRSV